MFPVVNQIWLIFSLRSVLVLMINHFFFPLDLFENILGKLEVRVETCSHECWIYFEYAFYQIPESIKNWLFWKIYYNDMSDRKDLSEVQICVRTVWYKYMFIKNKRKWMRAVTKLRCICKLSSQEEAAFKFDRHNFLSHDFYTSNIDRWILLP